MHRHILIGFVCATVLVGCGARTPVSPDVGSPSVTTFAQTRPVYDERYRLAGEWTFFISAERDRVDVVPRRDPHFHLNALKFLEEYCKDCLQITGIKNNGDGTIDLTVRISHPFKGLPQYTGFDVKGIIMFNGSHKVPFACSYIWPYGEWGNPSYLYINWRETGDPELLNPDGYTVRWSPWWPSDSSLPIFNYWRGKYAIGNPTASVNAYLNFYTDAERHMFRVDGQVERTYRIWLPPGPVAAGYAVEACWVPPTVTPVTDPLNDFPISANQEEPYHFRYVLNNDEVITSECCFGDSWTDCSESRVEVQDWTLPPPEAGLQVKPIYPPPREDGLGPVIPLMECDQEPPPGMFWFNGDLLWTHDYHDGSYRGVAVIFSYHNSVRSDIAYDVYGFTIDME